MSGPGVNEVVPTAVPGTADNRAASTGFVDAALANLILPVAPITDSFIAGRHNVGLAIDGSFAVVAGALALAAIASGNLLANSTAGSAEPAPTTLTALIDRALGSTRGAILERGASGWAIVAPGATALPWVSNGAAADPAYQLLTVPGGGTGLATLTANAVLLGAGAGNLQFATIGTAGRLLIDQGAAANPAFTAMSGDATIAGSGALTIAANAVSNAKFRQSAALALVGNATNATANVADIVGTANQIPIVNNAGSALAFTTVSGDLTNAAGAFTIANLAVTTAKINNAAVTYAKIQNASATTLLGNPTGGATSPSEITLGATLAFSGTALQTAAHTGDVTTAANSFVTTVAKIAGTTVSGTTGSGNVVFATAPTIAGGTHTAITSLGIRSTGAAFDLTLASSEAFTAGRTLTLTLNDAARTISLSGNLTLAGAASLPAIAQGDLWYGSATGVISALAKSASASQFLKNSGTSNNPAWAQPAASDLSNGTTGSGNVVLATTPSIAGGALSGTFSGTPTLSGANFITLANIAQIAAFSLLGNTTGSTANIAAFTIGALTQKVSPAGTDLVLIQDQAASGALKYATVSAVAAGATVASIAGNTGVFTLSGGITNSVNDIRLDGNYAGWAVQNASLAASVGSSILTVSLKDNAGSNPSSTSPVNINYRNVTAATGSTTLVQQTGALSITTNAVGASLGTVNSTAFRFWVVVINNGGSNVLALINCTNATNLYGLDESRLISSTAMSASATSAGVFYTPNGTTVTAKAFRVLGYIEYASGLATAGTYASAPDIIQVHGPGIKLPGDVLQTVYSGPVGETTTTAASGATSAQAISASITPSAKANPVLVRLTGNLHINNTNAELTALQLGRATNASLIGGIAQANIGAVSGVVPVTLEALDFPQTTSAQTYGGYLWGQGHSVGFSYGGLGNGGSMVLQELQA